MKSFEEEFPSLKCAVALPVEGHPFTENVYYQSTIENSCIDKARVRKVFKSLEEQMIKDMDLTQYNKSWIKSNIKNSMKELGLGDKK